MVNQENVEKLFDIIDESCCFLFDKLKLNYMKALLQTTENIVTGSIVSDLDEKEIEELNKIYDKLDEVNTNSEEARKAMQYLIMKAFKEISRVNVVTPDKIGFLFAYLVNKMGFVKNTTIFDMALGTGNLLATVANQIENPNLFGIDIDDLFVKIAKMTFSMLDYDASVFLGDTLDFSMPVCDLIIGDLTGYNQELEIKYFPYNAILHHQYSLNEDGFMMLLIPNDFFSQPDMGKFKELLELKMCGLIELPDKIFKGNKKSILLLKKGVKNTENFLLVKIPDFEDQDEMNKIINKIEEWFKKEMH